MKSKCFRKVPSAAISIWVLEYILNLWIQPSSLREKVEVIEHVRSVFAFPSIPFFPRLHLFDLSSLYIVFFSTTTNDNVIFVPPWHQLEELIDGAGDGWRCSAVLDSPDS